MKKWQDYLGLAVSILFILIMAAYPVVTDSPSKRESIFTILRAVALAASLNIFLGYTGYVSFGHIVYFGFGGYVGFYLITQQEWSLWPAMAVGGLASGFLAFLLGKAILRLRGAYFALATIGINEGWRCH